MKKISVSKKLVVKLGPASMAGWLLVELLFHGLLTQKRLKKEHLPNYWNQKSKCKVCGLVVGWLPSELLFHILLLQSKLCRVYFHSFLYTLNLTSESITVKTCFSSFSNFSPSNVGGIFFDHLRWFIFQSVVVNNELLFTLPITVQTSSCCKTYGYML